jgi:predicted transcriptional regulator
MPRVSEAEKEERIKRCSELLKQGLTRKEIAQRLGVSLPTVFNYIKVAKERGLLGKDEKEHKKEEKEGEFLKDLKALVNNAPLIEKLVSHINFNQSPREVLKQVEDIKKLYQDEFNALGYLAVIFEGDSAKVERQLKDLGVDVAVVNQIRATFANILRYAKVLFIRDSLGVENELCRIRGRRLYNFNRNEPLIEIEIHTDLEIFKTRDKLDSLLKLVVNLLLHCGETIHEISSNHLPVNPDDMENYKEQFSAIGRIVQKALEDLETIRQYGKR